MQSKRFQIGVLDSSHAADLAQLRINCYRQSSSFSWFDETQLAWTAVDTASVILGAFTAEKVLISTVRCSTRRNRAEVDDLLAYSTANVPERFPALVSGRSATATDFAKHGLAAAMRRVIITNALRLKLASLTGVVFEDAPRVRSMLHHGYEFFDAPNNWDTEATLLKKPIIISMPSNAFSSALKLIETESSTIISECEFDDQIICEAFDQDAKRCGLL